MDLPYNSYDLEERTDKFMTTSKDTSRSFHLTQQCVVYGGQQHSTENHVRTNRKVGWPGMRMLSVVVCAVIHTVHLHEGPLLSVWHAAAQSPPILILSSRAPPRPVTQSCGTWWTSPDWEASSPGLPDCGVRRPTGYAQHSKYYDQTNKVQNTM